MKAETKIIAHQASWVVRSREIELSVTQLGGHMAPVVFDRRGRRIEPYYINPWHGEGRQIDPPVLVPLRGDFFCMPFGGDNAYRGESHTPHGEPATGQWTLADVRREGDIGTLSLAMETHERAGRVTKHLSVVDGEPTVYVRHVLDGYSGPMSLGHHATLAVPEKPGALRISTSRFALGKTNPTLFSDPATGEYQSLGIDQRFTRLSRVPLIWADPEHGDCSALPTRTGFTDLLAVYKKPSRQPAWTAAVNQQQGYLWFSLKDPSVLPATVMWISNRGRHGPPWDGRNRCVGLEDVCAYFAEGLKASARKNEINAAGFPTAIRLSRRKPRAVNYIEGAVAVPRGFKAVRTARFAAGKVTFVSTAGKAVAAPVRHEFLRTGELA